MLARSSVVVSLTFGLGVACSPSSSSDSSPCEAATLSLMADPSALQREVRNDPPGVPAVEEQRFSRPVLVRRGPFVSVQVNVDAGGLNILGDAANEPWRAGGPTQPPPRGPG